MSVFRSCLRKITPNVPCAHASDCVKYVYQFCSTNDMAAWTHPHLNVDCSKPFDPLQTGATGVCQFLAEGPHVSPPWGGSGQKWGTSTGVPVWPRTLNYLFVP